MTGFATLCAAGAARCRDAAPELEWIGEFMPNPPIPSGMWMINPVGYSKPSNLGGHVTHWMFTIRFTIPAIDQAAAWARMSELTDRRGPVIQRILDLEDEIDDDFAHLTTNVEAGLARDWVYKGAGQRRSLRSHLGVELHAV